MGRLPSLSLAIACALWASSARADGFDEIVHEMSVELHAEHATVLVRRSVATKYDVAIEAHLHLDVGTAIATGLRTRADDGTWHDARLLDVDHAVDTYWKLTGSKKVVPEIVLPRGPTWRAEDPALLMWSRTGLDLYMYPVTAATPRTVEYTLQIPYEYEEGVDVLRLPVGAEGELAPRIRFANVPGELFATVADARVKSGTELVDVEPDDVEVRIRRARPELAVTLSASPAGDRYLARIAVEAGPELGPEPDRTHAVIVLDRSRSMGPDSMVAARTMLLSYLDRLAEGSGARVEVVRFDRRVRAEHGKFVTPADARTALAAADLSLANGSDLPRALAAAGSRLRAAPRGAPRRAIVVTDATLATADERRMEAALGAVRAVVHLVDVTGARSTTFEVDREHRLRDAVTETGGAVWVATVDPNEPDVGRAFHGLVRPDRFDDLELRVDGVMEPEAFVLEVGEGTFDVRVGTAPPRRVTADGWLWGRHVRVEAFRSTRADAEWSRLAAAYLTDELTEEEIVDVARRSRAVTPKTALLALEPGMKPSEEPALVDAEPSRRGWSSCGLGGAGSSGGFGRYSLEHDEPAFVRRAVADATEACGAEAADVTVVLTTAYAEVLSIDDVRAPDDAAAVCIRDALWELEFPPGRHAVVQHRVQAR